MSKARTLASDMARVLRECTDQLEGSRWPSEKWVSDPVGFARVVLGVRLWDFQVRLLEAIRDHRHVSVAGGRKIGKDFGVAIAAIWWFCSFKDARVFLLAPTSKQLDGILYREIRVVWSTAGRCYDCKQANPTGPTPCEHSARLACKGKPGVRASTGIKATDFREILGATAIAEGGLRGFSGARVLAIEDEASDINDDFDTALVGNLAGADCHRVLISNPTRTVGFFYRSFHEERALFHPIQQDTRENPNVVEGKNIFPGLADRQWIDERRAAWGEGSPLWLANVEGKFPRAEKGQLFTLDAIQRAEQRWIDITADELGVQGRLSLGIDVAGATDTGDETCFAPRRGDLVYELEASRGLTEDRIVERAAEFLAKYRRTSDIDDDLPTVTIDRDGEIGARVYDSFRAYKARVEGTPLDFVLIGFRGGAPPRGRLIETYRFARDELFAGLVLAFKDGLGIPSDLKLEAELVVLRWLDIERGRSQLLHKREIREMLGRSPDRLDALALSTWGEKRGVHMTQPDDAKEIPTAVHGRHVVEDDAGPAAGRAFDPYSRLRGRGGPANEDPDD